MREPVLARPVLDRFALVVARRHQIGRHAGAAGAERVAVIAKRWDKKTNSRQRWNKLIQAGQSFDAFVRRECEFVRMTTKGNQVKEKNAELACRINYYRMRTDVLETRYLAAEKH